MDVENLPPPKTTEELGIYVAFMFREIRDLKNSVNSFQSNKLDMSIFLEHKELINQKIQKLEDQAKSVDTFISTWSGKVWGINSTIGVVIAGAMWLLGNWDKIIK